MKLIDTVVKSLSYVDSMTSGCVRVYTFMIEFFRTFNKSNGIEP